MKIVVFSGPTDSGKSTQAYQLRQSISDNPHEHKCISGYRLSKIFLQNEAILPGVKTILCDSNSLLRAKQTAKALSEAGFNGTFIATTKETPCEDDFKNFGSQVTIHQLKRITGIWSRLNIKEEAQRLAEEYNGMVLDCLENGSIVAYKVVFKNSQMTVIFKNRNGGML